MRASLGKSRFQLRALLLASAAFASLCSVQNVRAATIFSDNFNSYTGQLAVTGTFGPWDVSQGSIDLIPVGSQFNFYPGNGTYVDLNGTTDQLGGISTLESFAPGTYSLTFNLGGSMGGQGNVDPTSKTTQISLGDWSTMITLAPDAGMTSQTFAFTTTGGALKFVSLFSGAGENNNVGNILDNVALTATPLPATWSLLISGCFGIGFMAYVGAKRRRRRGSLSLAVA